MPRFIPFTVTFAPVGELDTAICWVVPCMMLAQPARRRFMLVGLLSGKHLTAFITDRGDRVRLIWARRSRPAEVTRYDDHG